MTARQQLDEALTAMGYRHRAPLCSSDPNLWTSDHHADLTQAARWCHRCELLTLCHDVGTTETWHVWGGAVRTTARHPQRTTTAP